MRFITVEKEQNNCSQWSAFASSAFLHRLAIFHFKLCYAVFVGGGESIYLGTG